MQRGSGRRTERIARAGAALWLVALLAVGAIAPWSASAAPGDGPALQPQAAQGVPDWLSPETAARLDLGFDVLVPPWVPGPFAGEPSVQASGGYYRLYWVIPGSPPTYLEITGTVGGDIPDFSWYDRNVQLQQNTTVQGVPAHHDLTPIYDLVYWQVGDVVYSVSSQGLTDTDTLSLANALQVLTGVAPPPDDGGDDGSSGGGSAPTLGAPETVRAGEAAAIGVEGTAGATLTADAGVFVATGEAVYRDAGGAPVEWEAPATAYDLTVTFTLTDPETGDWLASAQTLVLGAADPPDTTDPGGATVRFESQTSAVSGELVYVTLYGNGTWIVNATLGTWPAQSPNTLFAADAGGGDYLIGTLPDDGAATLIWRAPEVSETATGFFYATDVNSNTPAEWMITVEPGQLPPNPTPPPTRAATAPTPAPNAAPEHDGDAPPARSEDGGGTDAAPAEPGDQPAGDQPQDASQTGTQPKPAQDAGQAHGRTGSDGSGGPDLLAVTAPTAPTASASVRPAAVTDSSAPAPSTSVPSSGLPSPPGTPAPAPTPTVIPTAGSDGLVAGVIGPDGGTLVNPAGAALSLPPGALTAPSTVSIVPVPDPRLPVLPDVDFIPGTGFDVSVAAANGQSIEQLEQAATLRMTLTPERWRAGAVMYRVTGGQLERLAGSALDAEGVSASLDHFSRFAVGVPVRQGDEDRGLLPWFIAGVAAILLFVVGSTVTGLVRHRRPRTVVTRRRAHVRSRVR